MNLPPEFLLAIAAVIAIVVAVLVVRVLSATRRREAVREAAPSLGMEFGVAAPELVEELRDMGTMSHGHSHELRNVLRGERGNVAVTVADHRWVTGAGKNRHVHRAALVVLRRQGLALPHFFMRHQWPVLDSIGKLFGGQDIDFPEDSEFSSAVVLQGKDEAAVRALFGPSLRPQVLQAARDLRVEGRGDTLLVQRSHTLAPEDVMSFIESATALLEVFASGLPRSW